MNLNDLTVGLRSLAASDAQRDHARRALETWWTGAQFAAFRPQLESLAQRQQWKTVLDCFYRTIAFGTGGRRGPVGIGPNRINQHTVLTSVLGHVRYLQRRFPTTALRVVVAFDVRVFRDFRGVYDPAVPNPLLGLSSRDLARFASAVYAANDIEVYTVSADDGYYLSTPELSFAVRHLHAHGGLNVSASHNHPDDNGAKFYMASGGQPVPPEDQALEHDVQAITEVPPVDFDAACRTGRVRWWDGALHERYLEASLSRSLDPSARQARVVYTPLHGTGRHTVGDLLPRAGFEVRFVERQLQADGTFPAVKFRIPNPEVPESMEMVTAAAQEYGADVGFATDPDADRLGVVAAVDGVWRSLTGNEIAVLLAAYIIETRRALGTLPAGAFVIKTAVTSTLLTRIAHAHGVQMLGDLLVGFKYVGQVLDAIALHGCFRDLHGTLDDFLLAAEESNGLLVSAELRDKDAAGGALLLAELCARLRREGTTLDTYLHDVYRRYGYPASASYSLVMEGLSGSAQLAQMMDHLRAAPPGTLEGRSLHRCVDHWDEHAFGAFQSETDRSGRNFIQLQYDGGLHVAVRPSGTEPKIKIYVELVFDPAADWEGEKFPSARRAMDDVARAVVLSTVDRLLESIGIALPRAALLVSPLVSLEQRVDFGTRFLPELEAQLRGASGSDASQLAAWVDARLQAYGSDPRALVAAGVAEHARACAWSPSQVQLARQLFEGA